MSIRDATDDDRATIRELFWEYLQWANGQVNAEFGVTFDIAPMLESDMDSLAIFSPPDGRIVLAIEDGYPVGIGCLKKIGDSVAELKRMYVRPAFRGRSLGRVLLTALITAARDGGYRSVRLDSAGFMTAAHALYRSAGFQDIKAYPESEIPAEFRAFWVFMEKSL